MRAVRMFRRYTTPVALAGLAFVFLLTSHAQVRAVTRYFDVNGTGAGSGVTAAGVYNWEDPLWNNNDATGTTAPTTWEPLLNPAGDFPKFAAATDASGLAYTVNVNANHFIAGMQLAASGGGQTTGTAAVTINSVGGAALTLNTNTGGQGFFVAATPSAQNLVLNVPIGGDAVTPLFWSGGGGSLYLYGNNTYAGGTILNTGNGLNFNNSNSFGTGSITFNTGINTGVLANPAVGNFSVANAVIMPAQTTVNKTMIYTGTAPVTFTNWTLGDSPAGFPTISNVLTVSNTTFASAKLIINNLAGTANSNLTVNSPAATNGTLVLTGTSTYGGAANGGSTVIGTNTTGNPALQADDGTGLPTNSFLLLNGGVLQTSGSFTRPLAASFGHNMAWNIGGGGFSAIGSQLTVDIGGAGAQLAWGDSALTTGNPDLGNKILGPLKFGSVGSNALTKFVDPIDLNPAGVASPARVITVTGGAGGDSTELSGAISSSNDPGGTPATLTKNGTGTLVLSATNTYSGTTTVAAGTLSIASVGNTSANSNIGTNGTIHLGATTTAGTLKYTGTGETSNKVLDLAGTTGGGVVDQSGTGLLKFTSSLTATGAGAKTLTLQGSTAGTGEIDGAIVDSTGATSLTKAGSGTWTLAGANTYTGTTAVNAGTLILANASAMPSANALSLGGGTLTNSTGGLVTVAGATSLTTNSTLAGANGFTLNGAFTNTAAANRTLTNNSSGLVTLGAVNLSNSGTARVVTFSGTGNTSITGTIANGSTSTTSGLTKSGLGTLTVTGNNTYGGVTTVSQGTLLVNNDPTALGNTSSGTGSGTTTVAASATLGGTGRVGGAITNSGIISPGSGGVGTLAVAGNVTDSAGSSWSIDLSGATSDKLAVVGNIDLTATDTLNVLGSGTGTSWLIGTYTGTETGTFDTVTSGYTVSYTGGNITLNAVPAGLPGDFNSDGKVDAGDYVTWRKNQGTSNALANDNGLGVPIGTAHYDLWRANFGNPPGSGSGGGLGANGGAVPEPSSIALLMLSLAALVGRRR